MNNTHLKKLLTIFLSLMLSVSMLPASVFADAVNESEDQGQVATETVDQDETSAPEQSADVNKGSSEPADAVEKSEDQGQVATETVDQDETSAPEQSADVNKGSSEPADAVEKAEKDTPKGESYDFEMNGEKWVISGDASADTEDEKTWKAMFADSKFTDNWAEDLVMVAKSQVGYKESKKNFAVSENKDRKGYTRYGAWAGEPYADWSPLFVSFCLDYANVDMPYYKEDFDKWIADLEKEKMFADADGYVPRSGDLVFYDLDKDGDVDAAGIVESFDEDEGVIEIIEGDYKDEVAEREVKTSDPTIAGYGILPENPDASDKEEPKQEENANRSLKKGEPTRGEGDDYPPGYNPNSDASVYGYQRFGDPDNDPRISVQIVESEDFPSTIMAGDTLNYVIKYTYLEIPELNFGYPKAMPIYDKYKNNTITITLPAGLLLAGQDSPASNLQSEPNDQDPNVAHTYTFTLPEVTANDQKLFGISVYVCNNGTDKSVASYDPIQVTSHTEFDVIDYTGGKETPVGHYTQEVSNTSEAIQTVTPDKWGVEKSIKSGYPKFSDDGTKAIFAWEVKVGLLDNDGNVITDVSKYNRPGRDAVESIKLQDTLSTVFSKNGNTPPGGTLTISKASGGSKTFTSGTPIELKDEIALDVSAEADKITTNGSSDPAYLIAVPTLTTYTVTAEYPVTSDMIAEFYQDPYRLDSTNKAKVSEYKLADIPAAAGNETEEIPESLPLGLTNPASVKVGKSLREYAAGNVLNPYDDRYEAIAFKITDLTSADGKFTVYQYRANPAPHYIPIEGMTDVTEATLVKGTTYYLAPGHQYKIVEDLTNDQYGSMHPESTILNNGTPVTVPDGTRTPSVEFTPAAKSNNTVDFVNKEVRGKIIIVKKDNASPAQPISGAKFTVQRINEQGNPIGDPITVETGDNGKVTVKNLPFGTYKVTETYVKEGYVMDPTPQTVEVTEGKTEQQVTLNFKNKINGATLTLYKYVAISEATFKTTANQNFTGTFQLYRSSDETITDQTVWEEVSLDSNTVNSNGVITKVLPPFTSDGTPYWYKFVETIPGGYYDPISGSTTTAETEPIKLTQQTPVGIEIADNKEVKMYNRKLVKAHIQKKFYSVGADGKLAFDKDQTTKATLYKYVGNDTAHLTTVQANFDIGGGTSSTQPTWVDIYDLKLYEGSDRIHYLIKENSVDGYLLDWASITGTKKTIDGVDYIELDISATMSSSSSMTNTPNTNQPNATAVLNNIEQKIPVKVVKFDYYTGKFVEGSKFSAYNAAGTTVVNSIAVPSTGYTFELAPGQVYTYKETTIPTNYHLHSYTDANGDSVKNSNGDGTIDLTGSDYVLKYADVGNDLTVERRIYNYQDPLIRIMKKDKDQAAVSGAKFTVYKKADNGDYYVAVTAENAIDSNVDSNVRLPAGEYYIHESTVPDGYLDPDKHYDLYHDLDSNYIKGHTGSASGPEKVLRKVTVTNGQMTLLDGSGTDNICKFDFVNIKNKGSLKVLKKVYDTLTQGFTIVVKKKNDQGELVEVARENTDGNGAAVFDNLDVYDANGDLIEYTITEELTGTQEPVYYQYSADQIATLSTTGQTTKDTSNKDLVVVNHTKVKVDVRKVFRNTWDYVFTHMDYPMKNAIIGLFVKEGDNWVKVADSATTNPATTNEDGYASFTGLRRDREYAFVELSSGNDNYFPYNADGSTYEDKWKLKYPSEGVTSIPDSDIGKYNVRFITPDQMSDKTKIEFTVNKDLVNANHWVQFDITKWLDHDTYNPSEGESPIYGDAVNKSEDTKYDNAVFKLYRFVMPGETGSVSFPNSGITDTQGNEIPWDLVGTYTTGTKYVDAVRQIGEFMTNVEQNVNDHFIYMLVEIDPGPSGGVINPKFQYTFWQADGKSYTVSVPALQSPYVPRQMYYTMDQVNYDDILNAHPVGPGTGVIYLASIRIAKWQDVLDTKTGEWKKEYTPLPNTVFEVRLKDKDGAVLATLTTGLDATVDDDKAWAQSGTYQLIINDDGTFALKDYETQETIQAGNDLVVTPFEVEKDGRTYHGYKIPVVLVETDCPDGYSYDTNGYEMFLCFFDLTPAGEGSSWVFNDAFFATSATESYTLAPDGTQTAWYITDAENHQGIPSGFFLGDDQSIRRIVDYPIHNTFVTVHKYGYAPNADTISGAMTSTDLDKKQSEEINREPLPGVTMYLQHRKSDGSWEFWDYKLNKATTTAADAKFVTTEGGGYIFPDGLKPGVYRIYETSLPDNERSTIYDNAAGTQKELIKNVYEMAYYDSGSNHTSSSSHSHARIFTVDTDNKSVTMYNPKKVDLTLIKKDLDGKALSGTSFSLKYPTNNTASTGTTDADGKVVFRNITSRSNYWIVETKAGYSSEYLQQYLKSVDPSLANLAVAGTGARIGYTYTTKGNVTSDRDTYVNLMAPNPLITGSASLELTIKNPKKVNIEITKVDDRNTAITSGKAKFKGYYHPFTQDGNEFKFKNTFTSSPTSESELTSAGFARYPNESTELETDSGKLDLTNVDPGIYAFIETEAPAGYDVLKTSDGKDVIYFVIVKGGLDATVTGLATSVDTWAGSVTTLINGVVEEGVEKAVFSAKNYQQVTMEAKKELVYPAGADADSWTIYKPWEVRLDLYAADKTTVLGSATFTNTSISTEPVTFKKNGADVKLSKGETYYVKEAVVAPTANFDLVKLLAGSTEVTDVDANGFYKITVKDEVVVTAQNKFLWGQVKFKKYDGADVANNDFSKPLEGAEFEVRYYDEDATTDDKWVKVPNSSVEYDSSTKSYIADIPLISEVATTYRIYETKAPANHLLNPDLYLEVQVPQTVDGKLKNIIDYTDSRDPDKYLVNTEGNNLTITKYDNLHGVSNHTVGQGEASFTVYHRKSVDPEEWEVAQAQTGTDGNGKVTYLTTPGETYAIAETAHAAKFLELDGIYRVTGEGTSATETELTDTVDITINGNTVTAYVIVSSKQPEKIVIKAYNKPLIKPMIVKQDAGGYPQDIVPIAFFSIYEISSSYVLTDSSVDALVNSKNDDGTPKYTPVYTGYTNASNIYTKAGGGTYGDWDAAENGGQAWDPTKRYVIVETKVASGTAGKDYDTLNKDDNRVEWYWEAPVVAEPDPKNPPVYFLKNVYGDATADIVKKVVNNTTAKDTLEAADTDNAVVGGEVESLLTGQRKVVYTIKPSADSTNQALESYKVTDSGITFEKKKADYTGGPQPSYSIDSVTVGKATQDTSKLDFTIPENTVVSAKVTFDLIGGGTEVKNVDLTDAQGTVVAPENGKAKSFVIEYYSSGVSTATGEKYALGYDFNPGEITVNATIDKLSDGDADEPVNEVTKFTNHSAVDMVYPKWKDDGSGMVDPAPSVHETSDATINVRSLRMPKISVSKEATDGTTTTHHITLGGFVIYKIGVSNKGDTDFINPVILDMLPTGVTFDPDYPVTYDSNTSGHNEQFEITAETRTGKVTQTYEGEGGAQMGDAETAVIFKLKKPDGSDGVIEAGSTIYLFFKANIKDTAGMYEGDMIENDVFASTAERTFHTTDNPNGYGFTDAGGKVPGTLDQAAKALDENGGGTGTVAQTREGGLHDDLGSYAYNESDGKPIEYVWVPAKAEVTYGYASKITLKKAVWGDRDAGYEESKNFLGMSTRTNVPGESSPLDYADPTLTDQVQYSMGSVGWTKWRLSVENGSTLDLTRVTVGDIIPKQNDGRLSSWESVWRKMLGVQMKEGPILDPQTGSIVYTGDTVTITEGTGTDADPNKYTIFFYVGPLADVIDKYDSAGVHVTEKGVLTEALEETGYWHDDHSISKPATDTANWKTLSEITDYSTIKAFIIIFDKGFEFRRDSDLVASYQTTVANMTDGTEFNNEFAFKNDNNIFRMNYRNSDGLLTSNQVSVTLMDKPVSVEGDLWIDEDWDGVQNKGREDGKAVINWDPETTRNGNRRDYSQYAIIQELIDATKYTITDLRAGQGTSENDLELGEYIGYGESVEHFRFEELIPGAIAYEWTEDDPTSAKYIYDADGNLKKEGLRTFEPAMYRLNVEVRNASLMNIFKITDKGTNYYRSNNPDIHNFTENIDNYVLDDNFFKDGTSNNVFVTKPFFIRYSTEVDKTKDWGVQLFRELVIEKQALDNSNVKIEGAKFEIYGPYGDSDIGERKASETTASGSALSFSKSEDGVYHLVRKEGDKYFREKDDEEVAASTVVTELVTGADGKISVSGLNWWKEYDIKETEAPEGFVIDGAVATAVGSAGTQIVDRGDGVFTLKVPKTTKTSEDGPDQVIVEDPRPVKLTPKVTKKMSEDSNPLPEAKTFKFELTATKVVKGGCYYWKNNLLGQPKKNFVSDGTGGTTATKWEREIEIPKGGTVGNVDFDELHFIHTGTYEFTIKEAVKTGDHIVYDTSTWKYTVVVSHDPDTNKLVASGSYRKVGAPEPTTEPVCAEFINKYTPEPAYGEVKAKKTLTGRVWLDSDSFEFTITPDPNSPKTAPAFPNPTVTITKADATSYMKSFGTVKFTEDGTYQWIVKETRNGQPIGGQTIDGITYPAEQTVTIKVKDDNGRLVADEGSNLIQTAGFENTYDASGDIALKGTKAFKHGSFDTSDPRYKEFTFSVYPKDDFDKALKPMLLPERDRNDESFINAVKDAKVGTATTSGATVEGDIASFDFKFKAANGSFSKDKLEYILSDIQDGSSTEAGLKTKTFEYVVVEDIPTTAVKKTVGGVTFYYDKAADIKYDPTVYAVTITVTDDGKGKLIVTKTVKVDGNVVPNSSGADYKFGFKNEKIYTKIKLTKVIDQQVAQDTEGELTNVTFVFKISYTDPVLGKPVGRTVSVQFDPKTGAANPNPAIVDKIPIDSEVKVTEVYAADYQCDGDPTQDAVLSETTDPETGMKYFTVSFSNNRQGNTTGSGVINTVDKNTFRITNRQDSTGTNKPPKAPR